MKIDRMIVCTAMSWLGLWVHEVHRVPTLLGLTPDGSLFMLLAAAGLAYWWHRIHGFGAAAGLLIYGALNLVGGWISVLPLSWLPFVPEQTAAHYAVHIVYAVAQLPLIAVSASVLMRRTYAPGR
jgi:hypothetical protein